MKQIIKTKEPSICLSILEETGAIAIAELKKLEILPFQVVEWRIDGLQEELLNRDYVIENYLSLKKVTRKPIFITLRTKKQGGQKEIKSEEYFNFMETLLEVEEFDGIDLEYEKKWKDTLRHLIEKCKEKNIFTILSYHDFEKTPKKEEIIKKIKEMKALGGDLPKAAYMPIDSTDVEKTISAIEELEKERFPFTLISMGELGKKTRINYGKITFARGNKETAKGQFSVKEIHSLICEEW